MLYLVDTKGVYSPEVVKAMTTAFDNVCEFIPQSAKGNDAVRQQYAAKIINLVDHGQQDPARLFELAFRELTGRNAPHPRSRNSLA